MSKRHATDGSSPGISHQCGMALVTGAGIRYDTAAIFSRFQPIRPPISATHSPLARPSPGGAHGSRPSVVPAQSPRPSRGRGAGPPTLRAQMRQDLAAFQAEGEAGLQPLFLALMAEMYERMGQVTAGLSTLDAALALARKPGSRYYEAEPVSAKGELLLARAVEHHAEVEACFRQALDVAHRQQAKSWELRAAMRLSWLWQGQGKRAEAYQLLAEVYSRFTEGFDTADLREAKAPLDDLA